MALRYAPAVDFSPAAMLFGVIFGSVGFAAFQIGRKRENWRVAGLGIGLMGLTFVAGGDTWSWIAAVAMTGLMFWP